MTKITYEGILKAAAEELGMPETDWQVEKLATLRFMFLAARSRWANGDAANSNDMLSLMDAITSVRQAAGVNNPRVIEIQFVEGMVARCARCGNETPVSEDKLAKNMTGAHGETVVPAKPTEDSDVKESPTKDSSIGTPPPLPPEITSGVKGYRPNVSGSAFHSAVLHNNEVAPLAKLQPSHYPSPRSVSPMSRDGHADPTPRRHNAPPQGSALDDPNPNRKAN